MTQPKNLICTKCDKKINELEGYVLFVWGPRHASCIRETDKYWPSKIFKASIVKEVLA